MRRKNKPRPCQCEKIERRQAARLDAWTAEWQSLLLPYLPELPALVSELRNAASQLERAALEASEGFDGIRVQARAALGGRSQELEQEIVRVMVALQFQDIVNQKITRAIDTLTRLDADLDKSLGRPVPEARSKRRVDGVSYSMLKHAPKETGRRLPYGRNGAVKGSEIEPSGDIEIFLPEVNS
jgi:hypothetical protein